MLAPNGPALSPVAIYRHEDPAKIAVPLSKNPADAES